MNDIGVTSAAIEKRSLDLGKWVNLFMGVAGIAAAFLSNADALLLDGLFSGVNFLSALVAARVAVSITRQPDATRPFGYEIDEAVYVMFRSLVLLGIILMALIGAFDKVVTYVMTGTGQQVVLSWIVGYTGLMVVLCFGLAAWHRLNLRRSGGKSALLKTEASAAVIDGVLSAAAGAAFIGLDMLRGTVLEPLVPVSDSVVVIALSICMLPRPYRMFRASAGEVLGDAIDPEATAHLKERLAEPLLGSRLELVEVGAVRTGRSVFVLAWLRPLSAVTAGELDEVRGRLAAAVAAAGISFRLEIALADRPPFEA
jgi:predicted Co/Zn/Cd cation transporter (cation efflux family)